MIFDVSSADLFAGSALTILSFLASVVQGSTSLGDGIFLQIAWGILQALVPLLGESSLGGDGLRVITMFMYIRLITMPTTLVYYLWKDHQKLVKASTVGANSDKTSEKTTVAIGIPLETSASSPKGPTLTGPPSQQQTSPTGCSAPPSRIISMRLFWLLTLPTIVWSLIGVMILQRINSAVLSRYMGSICITFSIIYISLKLWKVSAHDSMPRILQRCLSPRFTREGTEGSSDKHITFGAQLAFFLASNLCGLMTTLAGIGSPPMMVVILLYGMPVSLTRFTLPVGATFGAAIRLAYALYTGMVQMDKWPFYVPATIIGLVGLRIGVKIGNVLTPSMYSATIFCLLNIAGIVMLTSNTYVTVPALVLSCAALTYKHFWLDAAERRRAAESAITTTASDSSMKPVDANSPDSTNQSSNTVGLVVDVSHCAANTSAIPPITSRHGSTPRMYPMQKEDLSRYAIKHAAEHLQH